MGEFDRTNLNRKDDTSRLNPLEKKATPYYLEALIQGFPCDVAFSLAKIAQAANREQEITVSDRTQRYLEFHQWRLREARDERGNKLQET